ncbi:isoleucyl-tRNA synthetase [Cutibacterium acnes JCM 18909]|nr:isoleucyl-tRNA synthetase [Cutibacterium acnes JCM 18909]
MTDVNPVRSDNCRQYNNVPPQIDLPAMDHEIIDLWARQHTFDKSLVASKDGQPWTFFEGPPTANGQPGTHHVEARVFKDIFPRFKTMQGFRVDRKAGWDCHGLPVELAVEKELGFSGKPDIEKYGVEPFNAKCRESVTRHVDAFSELTERMGYWVNMDEAYWTMSRPTSSRCGGVLSESGIRVCSVRTTAWPRTARAAVPLCPTMSWLRVTRMTAIRRSMCGSR